MAMLEPDPADNEAFLALIRDIEIDPTIADGAVDATKLSNVDLTMRFHAAKRRLHELKEVMSPRTDEGREQHSIYFAALLEMKNRDLL